jgi:mannose-6-phosphate isomerase-like protein (cupin superfamily)
LSAGFSLQEALEQLAAAGGPAFTTLFEHGSLAVKVYAPQGTDDQTPHTRDEVYVVARGTGTFWDGERRRPFQPGDLLFVPAGQPHRFEAFTEDFATWVIFYGPEGGES